MRILLALDGSPSSIQARDLVAELPWAAGTTVRLVTAYDVPIDWTGGVGAGMDWVGDVEDARRDQSLAELGRQAEPFRNRSWLVDERAIKDRPATAIIDSAADFGADLIVLGSRGHGPLRSMLLGSVSAEVVDRATCPVLVARGDRVSRLLVATDGSESARTIPDVLGAWGVFHGVRTETLSVAPVPENSHELLDAQRAFAEEAAHRLDAVGIPSTAMLVTGDAAHEIIAAARRRHSDLIVTGSRRLHGLARVVLGSVARNVLLHAPCSVLILCGRTPARVGEARDVSAVTSPAPAGRASDARREPGPVDERGEG